ncbi:MAG TPA: PadR family transcriptional regulator [Candidatus Acidoferrales bacterium]|nr:PadR family transcriptional regulator [Candidatus Acidoferrales bacterium]
MDKQMELLQGTLDMLILKAVSLGPLHGYGILLRIQQISKDRLEIQQGSLYPALYRLEHQGWITSEWGESENNRKARFYRLTAAGRRRLQVETEKWNQMSEIIAGILGARTAAH